MRKAYLFLALVLAMLLALWGCSKTDKGTVYVENVGRIVEKGSIAINDKFPGVVVSEEQVAIGRDEGQTITTLCVEEGQNVKQGDMLFSYDSEAMSLELSKQQLELERLNNTVTTLKSQITKLQNEQKTAPKEDQLSYTVEIQDREAQLKEAEYNVKVKRKEIEQTRDALDNAVVYAPMDGRVVYVDKEETGEISGTYILIQHFGSFRIKGTVNELNVSAIHVGSAMDVTSRSGSGQTWRGTVTSVDLDTTNQGTTDDGSMNTSSSYAFYVDLQDSQGLMLGQHVYLEMSGVASGNDGLWLPEYYICYDTEGNSFVWAEGDQGLLERRPILTGGYDDASYTVEVLSGLAAADYIAFPADTCVTGATAIREDGTQRDPGQQSNQSGENVPQKPGENNAQEESGQAGVIGQIGQTGEDGEDANGADLKPGSDHSSNTNQSGIGDNSGITAGDGTGSGSSDGNVGG